MKGRPSPTEPPRERAVVAALVLPDSDPALKSDPLAEIAGLAEAAGAEVVGGLHQRLPHPDPRTAFGKGKVEELRALAQGLDATLVVVDFDLSPSQARNLEKALDRRVVDRTELILDVFASRAQTRQAKLQVELAQLEYLRPRLRRMWTHLERTEGAIGTRGPGETQLETDRRLIARKITDLKQRLAAIDRRRARLAESREHPETVSLVGYTNAGKSSLMNRLTGADVLVADMLFATLDTRVRTWRLHDGRGVLLADTVGFVRDLPHHLVASFHATLEETLHADLLLHVADANDPCLDSHLAAVERVLDEIGVADTPRLLVLNKTDLLDAGARARLEEEHPEALLVSVVSGEGLEGLDARVAAQLDRWSVEVEVEVPPAAGRLTAEFRGSGRLQESAWLEDGRWRARVVLPSRQWLQLRPRIEAAGGSWRPAGASAGGACRVEPPAEDRRRA